MSNSIRTLYVGLQSTVDVAAATVFNIPFKDLKEGRKANRHKIANHNGTRIHNQGVRRGSKHGELDIKTELWYDLIGHFLASLFNAPTTATHSGAGTGVKDHTFKPGSSVPLLTIEYQDENNWWQMLNCSVDQGAFTLDHDKPGEADWKIVGGFPTGISARSPVSQTWASYIQPAEGPALAMMLNGSAFADVLSGKLTIKANRKPFHTARRNANMSFAEEGEVDLDFDLLVRNAGYSGSLLEKFDTNLPTGAIVLDYIDTDTSIGTGTPTNPVIRFTIPSPELTTGDNDMMKVVGLYQLKGGAAYHTASAANIYALLTNEVLAYTAT